MTGSSNVAAIIAAELKLVSATAGLAAFAHDNTMKVKATATKIESFIIVKPVSKQISSISVCAKSLSFPLPGIGRTPDGFGFNIHLLFASLPLMPLEVLIVLMVGLRGFPREDKINIKQTNKENK
jgi:hypothetical protein